ncbi:MAG: hypothetical protein K2I67_01580 [Malacoplasma sp.]|nr:hypothetical protein [Malacoplasma sp.]
MLKIKPIKKVKILDKVIFGNVDIGVITSADIEFNKVLSNLEPFIVDGINLSFIFTFSDDTNLQYYFGSLEGLNVCLVQSLSTGNMSGGGAFFTIENLLRLSKPQLILMLGVCCGIDSKATQDKFSIYVSNSITYYEAAKVDAKYLPRAIVARQFELSNIFIEEIKSKMYTVKKGQYICGEKVVNNKDFKKKLQKLYPGAIALDMESYSLVLAAKDIPYIVIKAASDFGVNKKGSENQESAMNCVIDYVKKCLKNAKEKAKLSHKSYKLNVFISGTFDEIDNINYAKFVNCLTRRLLDKNYKIINGYGKGVGDNVISTVRKFSYANAMDFNNLAEINYFPLNSKLTSLEEYKSIAESIRVHMAVEADISLFLYGTKNGELKNEGVQREYQLSLENNCIIVPLASTGCETENIYTNYVDYLNMSKNCVLNDKLQSLSDKIDYSRIENINKYIYKALSFIKISIENRIQNCINE